MGSHFKRHIRFYSAAAFGIAAAVVTAWLAPWLEVVVGADTFFLVYLALTTLLITGLTPDELRRISGTEDDGIVLIAVIALAAIGVSLAAIFDLLYEQPRPGTFEFILALASAPLGWFMLHTIAALHYAHRYYANSAASGARKDSGGLKFPDTHEPHAWDFIYFSFVIGMTAQVSDVCALTTRMRQVILVHAVISFVFNTILIALAVNVAVALR